MAQAATKNVRYVKKVNFKHLFLIIVVLVALLSFNKVTHFTGKFTGEVADDDRMIRRNAVLWEGGSITAVLPNTGASVRIPQTDLFLFDSEVTKQPLNLGNPAENEYPMSLTLRVQDNDIYASNIFEPGTGAEIVETNAVFQPDTYPAVIVYTFYHLDGGRLKVMDSVEVPVTIEATGSGERYQSGQETHNS